MGWRFSGNLQLRVGKVCPLTVTLPTYQDVYVAAAIVRWIRAEEFGVKTLVMDEDSRDVLAQRLGAESQPKRRGPSQPRVPFGAFVKTGGPGGGISLERARVNGWAPESSLPYPACRQRPGGSSARC